MSAWTKVKESLWRVKTVKGKGAPGIIPSVVFAGLAVGLIYYFFFRDTTDPRLRAAERAAAERQKLVIQPGASLQAAQRFQKLDEKEKTPSELEKSTVLNKPTEAKTVPKTDPHVDAEKKTDAIMAQLSGQPVTDDSKNKNLDEDASGSIVDALSSFGDGGSSKAKKIGNAGVSGSVKATNIPAPAGSTRQTPKSFAVTYVNPNAKKKVGDGSDNPNRKPTGFETKHFLAIGELIPVYFMNAVESNEQSSLIELAVAENVIFNHRVQIPFGRKIFVTGGAKVIRDRMFITGGLMLDDHGNEGRVVGEMLDPRDETVGVHGYWRSMVLPKIFPYVNRFSALYLAALQDRQANPDSAGIGSLSSTSHDLALKEASKAISDAGDSLQKVIDQRYEDYLYVPKGTFAYLRLTQSCDVTMSPPGALSSQTEQPKAVATATKEALALGDARTSEKKQND